MAHIAAILLQNKEKKSLMESIEWLTVSVGHL
jgi:hypothetical protein